MTQALEEWINTVQADIERAFSRFRIWSLVTIPVILVLMSLKWMLLALLVPFKAIVYADKQSR